MTKTTDRHRAASRAFILMFGLLMPFANAGAGSQILPVSRTLFGNIAGKYPIHMKLHLEKNEILGEYFYDKKKVPIPLKGELDESGHFELREFSTENAERLATFTGRVEGSRWSGNWVGQKNSKLSFDLSEQAEDQAPLPYDGRYLYTVKSGDTFAKIAFRYFDSTTHYSWPFIAIANGAGSAAAISSGQEIFIPAFIQKPGTVDYDPAPKKFTFAIDFDADGQYEKATISPVTADISGKENRIFCRIMKQGKEMAAFEVAKNGDAIRRTVLNIGGWRISEQASILVVESFLDYGRPTGGMVELYLVTSDYETEKLMTIDGDSSWSSGQTIGGSGRTSYAMYNSAGGRYLQISEISEFTDSSNMDADPDSLVEGQCAGTYYIKTTKAYRLHYSEKEKSLIRENETTDEKADCIPK